jgi:hypothetical protein
MNVQATVRYYQAFEATEQAKKGAFSGAKVSCQTDKTDPSMG